MNLNGFINEIQGISVDSFTKNNFKYSSAFFLTHCHSDHTTNLINGFRRYIARNQNLRLYCSAESATVLQNMFPDDKQLLKSIIVRLPFDKRQLLIINGISVNVTAIRANHCVGSCMFLFETYTVKVLFTGDFRFHHYELKNLYSLHHPNGQPIRLDNVYLDTTFLNQVTYKFPTRKKVVFLIIREIQNYCNRGGIVHIKRPAKIGSEIIMHSLRSAFNCQIHVDDECYNLYRGVQPTFDCLTNNPNSTFIHMCDPGKPGTNHLCKSSANALKIHASALWYAGQDDTDWVQLDADGTVKIAHSMHSSLEELEAFIHYFQPANAVAMVRSLGATLRQTQRMLDALLDHTLNR